MLVLYILALTLIVGGLASRGNARSAFVYIPTAGLGAFVGAFAAFGDVPLLAQTGIPSPFFTGLAGALIFVGAIWLWRTGRKAG